MITQVNDQIQIVGVIIQKENRFLLGRRSFQKKTAGGYWCPVAGKIEVGESQEQAVVREVFEEIGLVVRPIRKLTEYDTSDRVGRLHWWMAHVVEDKEPYLKNNEHVELRWVNIEELNFLNPIFENDRQLMLDVYYRKI